MVIKNLTSSQQKLVIKEIAGDHNEFDLFVQPNGSTEIDYKLTVVNPAKYAGIFDFGGVVAPVVEKVVAPVVVEEPAEEVVEEVVEEVAEVEESAEEESAPEAFICDECGAEFASARGLATHKHKAHE